MASRPVCDNCNVPHDMSGDAEGKLVACLATGSRWAPRVEWACKSFERKAKEMATDLPKRDESRDMWVYESGGDCLGATEYTHYLEHGDNWNGEGEHYVPASELEAAPKRVGELESIIGNDAPWPLRDALMRLADGADHLLNDHSCDQHGYEELCQARDSARKIVESLLKKEAPGG
jgi:hypothetical protein